MEDDLKIRKVEYLSKHSMDFDWLEEIPSVALLSPACYLNVAAPKQDSICTYIKSYLVKRIKEKVVYTLDIFSVSSKHNFMETTKIKPNILINTHKLPQFRLRNV
jgi:hypothetical protein